VLGGGELQAGLAARFRSGARSRRPDRPSRFRPMRRRFRTLIGLAGLAAALVTVTALWLAGGKPPAYGELAAVTRWREDPTQVGTVLERVRLTSRSGRRVECVLRRPMGPSGRRGGTAVLLLGGIGTGRRAATVVDPRHDVVILACDYPWADPSRLPLWRLVPRLPAIRGEVLATPQALALAASFLVAQPEVDPRRLTAIGASLGVPFVAAWAAADLRVAAVALVYGGGNFGVLFEANLRRKIGAAWLRDLTARGAAALLRDLDPERTVGRIAPRPLLLIGSSDDERVPRASVEALARAAHGPTRSLRFGGRHMLPNDTALLRAITDSTYVWLARVVAPLSPYVPSRHLR